MTETKGQIFELIPKIMRGIGPVLKNRKNAQQGYSFRGIDDFYNAVHPMLIEHGVFIVPQVTDRVREERQTNKGGTLIYTTLTVKHTFYAPDGSSLEAITVGEAMDSGDKSANKAMSAAMKYALIEVFAIPTEGDNDTENHTHQVTAPRQQPARPAATEPKATPERAAELIRLCIAKRVPESDQNKWRAKAKADSYEGFAADAVEKLIAHVTKMPDPKDDDGLAGATFVEECEQAAKAAGLTSRELATAHAEYLEGNKLTGNIWDVSADHKATILRLITEKKGFYAKPKQTAAA